MGLQCEEPATVGVPWEELNELWLSGIRRRDADHAAWMVKHKLLCLASSHGAECTSEVARRELREARDIINTLLKEGDTSCH